MYKCITTVLLILWAIIAPTATQSGNISNSYMPAKTETSIEGKIKNTLEAAKQRGCKVPLACVVIAQYKVESKNGNSYLSTAAHNYFGVNAKPGDSFVWAVDNGNRRKFKKYSGIEEALNDYVETLNKPKYKRVFSETTPFGQALAMQKAGYAEDTRYAHKIAGVVVKNNLTQYDL